MATAEQTYFMLGNAPLWETARHCTQTLTSAGVPHAIVGGVAVCLHGYRRNTVDLDLLVRREDSAAIRTALESNGYAWMDENAEFRSPAGVPVQFVIAGDRAGNDLQVFLPDPSAAGETALVEDLPVLRLSRLIESKVACGSGNPRRMHRDFADVIELISLHQLSRAFARFLHPSLRPAFRKLVQHARGE